MSDRKETLSDERDPKEIAERMERGLRKSLTMAPKPHEALKKGKKRGPTKGRSAKAKPTS